MILIWVNFISILLVLLVEGHSINNQKLNRIEPITNIKLDITSSSSSSLSQPNFLKKNKRSIHDIEYEDKIRLQFDGFNQSFSLHLEPNIDLFHPNATIYHSSPSSSSQQIINPTDYRIYKGNVIHSYYSNQTWKEEQIGILPQHEKILGWARVILRKDLSLTREENNQPIFEGSFSLYNDIYHIKSFEAYHMTKRSDDPTLMHFSNMILYRDSDLSSTSNNRHHHDYQNATLFNDHENKKKSTGQCGFDHLSFNHQYNRPYTNNIASVDLFSSFQDVSPFNPSQLDHHQLNKRAATGCPTTKKIAYMGAAADCTYTKYYKTKQQAAIQIINDWNSVSAIYENSFNIQLGLVNITIMDEICPDSSTTDNLLKWNQKCSEHYTLEDRLSDFSQWRGSMNNDGIALWHLVTNCATGIEVGIAWVDQLCNSEINTQYTSSGKAEYVSGAGVSSIVRDEWKVIAHEIGHGFGAIHDCTSSNCPCTGSACQCCPLSSSVCDAGGNYIMNPTSNVTYDKFSPCSISTICNNIPNMGYCLEEPGSRNTKTLQMCGNGIVEQGEDCDPGDKSSSCCDPTTCKFINNAVCDDANDACCDQCQYRPSTYQCRPATSSCDIAEYCPGNSGSCPTDTYRNDGESCGSDGLTCASGHCTSRNLQCQYRGATLNISKACPGSNSCQLSCSNPSGVGCVNFNGYVIDGTPCGLNGKCKTGNCDEGSIGDRALAWLSNNKHIAIPVGVVLILIILGSICSCCWFGCCGKGGYRNRKKKNKMMIKNTATQPFSAHYQDNFSSNNSSLPPPRPPPPVPPHAS